MENEYDTQYTREPVCPHCGKEVQDIWELGNNDDYHNYQCGWCDGRFRIEVHCSVHYTTTPLGSEDRAETVGRHDLD